MATVTDEPTTDRSGGDDRSGGPAADEAALARAAARLADGVEAALPGWVERQVDRLAVAWHGQVADELADAARRAGRRARDEVGSAVRHLLETDVDAQHGNPLALLRRAVRYPTAVLEAAGVPPVERDAFAEDVFPDDVYDLVPAGFADLDPALQQPGIEWGAAKAYVVLARRRAEGRR